LYRTHLRLIPTCVMLAPNSFAKSGRTGATQEWPAMRSPVVSATDATCGDCLTTPRRSHHRRGDSAGVVVVDVVDDDDDDDDDERDDDADLSSSSSSSFGGDGDAPAAAPLAALAENPAVARVERGDDDHR